MSDIIQNTSDIIFFLSHKKYKNSHCKYYSTPHCPLRYKKITFALSNMKATIITMKKNLVSLIAAAAMLPAFMAVSAQNVIVDDNGSVFVFANGIPKKDWITIENGGLWYDTKGDTVQAHGAGFLKKGRTWYMVGEDRSGEIGVNLYSSTNLKDWKFLHKIITPNTNPQLKSGERFIERPKILYNKKTKQYVVWLHYEGKGYAPAEAAVFKCDKIDGDYEFVKGFRPLGNMSRDCGTYVDDDGTAYFFSAANDNKDLMLYRLTDDYLDIAGLEAKLFPGQSREAPVIFKRRGKYYLLSSACTGWEPNQGCYATADKISGPWSELKPFGDGITYDTQPTFALTIGKGNKTEYIYVGDRWLDPGLPESKTILLPLEFEENGELILNYRDSWQLNLKKKDWR